MKVYVATCKGPNPYEEPSHEEIVVLGVFSSQERTSYAFSKQHRYSWGFYEHHCVKGIHMINSFELDEE